MLKSVRLYLALHENLVIEKKVFKTELTVKNEFTVSPSTFDFS